ncbi:MAG: TetR family transcriptional regulator [Saprospiraceae bacterium]|nr:TetR family transcriptional regulator [Saprospiraceae bacterium]
MEFDLSRFVANINKGIYLKDPESSVLGRNILKQSIDMIDKLGFEEFTFKKLSQEIQSSEASVYRYFDNKHKLLLYLSSLYWGWVEYQLVLRNANISDPVRRLSNAIEVLTISNDDFKSTRDKIDFKNCLVSFVQSPQKRFSTKVWIRLIIMVHMQITKN